MRHARVREPTPSKWVGSSWRRFIDRVERTLAQVEGRRVYDHRARGATLDGVGRKTRDIHG